MEKILVPLDGTAHSEQAIELAVPLARKNDSELLLVRLVEHRMATPPGAGPAVLTRATEAERDEALPYLEEWARKLSADGLRVRPVTALGVAGEMLLVLSQREGVDLIVMTSRGRTGLTRWLLGSVAETLLRQAPCPMLLASRIHPWHDAFKRVLVPLDGSPASLAVLHQLPAFLAPEAQVTALRASDVASWDESNQVARQGREKFLEALEEELRHVDVPGRTIERAVKDGPAADAILTAAFERDCDLIAMSTHGRTGFRRLLLGSVTERVLRRAECPVLVFPPEH